jgi:hypothetical protein
MQFSSFALYDHRFTASSGESQCVSEKQSNNRPNPCFWLIHAAFIRKLPEEEKLCTDLFQDSVTAHTELLKDCPGGRRGFWQAVDNLHIVAS